MSSESSGAAVAEKPVTKKVKAEKVKAPRKTITSTLWKLFARNSSYETIVKNITEEFPESKFGKNPILHYRYYRGKYNMQAKKDGFEPTTSVGPVVERKARVAKPKVAKKAKASKKSAEPQAEETSSTQDEA